MAGWLLCLTNVDNGQHARQSIAACREALATLKENDSWRFRAQGLMVAGLLLSSTAPEKPDDAAVDAELTKLFAMVRDHDLPYWNLWDDNNLPFAKEPGFKQNLKKALDASQASFLAAIFANPAPPNLPLKGFGVAHGWRIMPAGSLEESSQNLQSARAAWTTVLTALPPGTPPQEREEYHIMAADCFLAHPGIPGQSTENSAPGNLLVAAALLNTVLAGDAPHVRPLNAGRAVSQLTDILIQVISGETNQDRKIILITRLQTLSELALRVVPKGPGPGHQWRVFAHHGVSTAMFVLAQIPGQDKAALWRRGIAHYKAALIVHPGEEALALQDIFRTRLLRYRETYQEMGLDKDIPFDDIKPAQ